jgi:phosphotransferase system  glucose/maltose/N-acetylglucosamine-specific IIC component
VVLLGTVSAVAMLFDIETGTVLGFETVNTDVFGGIPMGLTAAVLFISSSAPTLTSMRPRCPANLHRHHRAADAGGAQD